MKKNNSNLIMLNIVFCVSVIIANIVGCKVISLGLEIYGIPLILSGGAITYAFTFLCTDIIGEKWGKREANKAVIRGLVAQLFALLLIVATMYLPTEDIQMQSAYIELLGQSPMFVLGSLCAYFASQKWDVWIFHTIRNRFKAKPSMRWVWNNASTISSQIIDTCIYAVIAFGIGLGWLSENRGYINVCSIIMGQYLLKVVLAIIDTPLFYYFTKNKSNLCTTYQNE